ncbi:nucleoside-diphosphate kinase [Tenuifilum sp.]|uniref:nucleoside-diphosphate kinase n=2 Tax=Tenuifilum sp. TaxID=2760880 RepID=UPI002D15017E|nr:nucleoside-diphosphate kinase [Tenuifilum sp.]HOK86215.1 nucleoside-diphosphate kinase [Tenuifilum sp.]HPP90441.1 nucleoside-diphosphate kinase [Tenuifilum sp.]
MNTRFTFCMIKPDAFKSDTVSDILLDILKAGFKIRGIKITMLTKSKAEQFYDIHQGKEFFDRLTTFMSSGPVMAMVLERPDAVESLRKLIGKTDPAQADEGTIRKKFGSDTTHNAVHAADSYENAEREWSFFFSKREIY